jgi:hypothetical protein
MQKPQPLAGAFLDFYFNYSGWRQTHTQVDVADLLWVEWFRGLTCDFWAKNVKRKFTGG